jgi:glutaredoxin
LEERRRTDERAGPETERFVHHRSCGIPHPLRALARGWGRGVLVVIALASLLSSATVAATTSATPGAAAAPGVSATPVRVVEVFVREGCPHCAEAEAFLGMLAKERLDLSIVVRDVGKDAAAMARLKELARAQGRGPARVPAVYVNGDLIVGYSTAAGTDRTIRHALDGARPAGAPVLDAGACEAEEGALSCEAPASGAETFAIGVFGFQITLDQVGLPLFTFVMGLLDGFNPCSMWVLLLMISLLAPLNDRPRMLAIAGTFLVVQAIAYFGFLAAWLNLFLTIGLSRASELVIAAVAILAGIVNVKDFFAFGTGPSLSIPEKSKHGIYARMRAILHAENLWGALVATVILGVLVQFVELLCTSGFPALFTRILTLHHMEGAQYYGYLLLYLAAYMLDDLMILAIGVITLSRHRLQEREGRWLKLISGLVMVGLGLYLAWP